MKRPAVDHSRRIAELDREIQNIGDAIAKGLLSDALAARLQAAEAERGRLIAAQARAASEPRKLSGATIVRCVETMRKRLAAGGEIARQVLQELFPRAIWLQPDDSGRFLWAEFDDGLRAALFDELAGIQYSSADNFPAVGESACVVAGGRYELYSKYPIAIPAMRASTAATE